VGKKFVFLDAAAKISAEDIRKVAFGKSQFAGASKTIQDQIWATNTKYAMIIQDILRFSHEYLFTNLMKCLYIYVCDFDV
jgi:hypothetical protein